MSLSDRPQLFDQPASVCGRLFVSFVCLNRQEDRKTGIDLGSLTSVSPPLNWGLSLSNAVVQNVGLTIPLKTMDDFN